MTIYDPALVSALRPADMIDEVSDTVTYIGYMETNDPTKCLIKKIETAGTETTFKYPNGLVAFDKVWADRATYTYNFKR